MLSLYVYEIDCDGRGPNAFEVYDAFGFYITTVENDNMGDWLADRLGAGYNVLMNTIEWWNAQRGY